MADVIITGNVETLSGDSLTSPAVSVTSSIEPGVTLQGEVSQGARGEDGEDGVTDHTLLTNIGTNTHAQIDTHIANTSNPHSVTKSQVGLGNADNTSDLNKPISTATQTALDAKQALDSDLTAIAGISPSNDDLIQRKAGAWTNRTPAQVKTDLSLTKSDVGLSNVDNTSDANKPVSTATQTALDGKVDENAGITGATKTKITYDSKGLVTAGADATQDDIGDGTTYKQFSDANKTKLAGIEAAADVTDAANVDAAGATMITDTTLAGNGYFLDEDDFASNSASKVASQQSIKAYVDAAVVAGGSYTDEAAQDAVGGMVADTSTIDFTYTDATPELKADVKDGSITYAKIQDVSATNKVLGRTTAGSGDVEEIDTTGSGNVVRATSPTLVTPTLGVASATSVNKVALTAPASAATLTIGNNKTLTVNNSLTLAGTDSTTMTFPGSTDTVAGLAAVQTITGAWTFNAGKLILAGATSGTTTLNATGAASGTLTLPAATDTLVGTATTDTLTNKTLKSPIIQQDWDGFIVATDTWTYGSATTFTISGVDRTAIFRKGTKIKLTQTTVKYFVVVSSSFATNTTVTITGGSDYSLANAAITSPYYSYIEAPQGYPSHFAWSPTLTGFSSNPASAVYTFNVAGNLCFISVSQPNNGTSNATGFTITLPITAATLSNQVYFHHIWALDNGTTGTGVDVATISSAGTTVVLSHNDSSAGWTSSGSKRANFQMWYRF